MRTAQQIIDQTHDLAISFCNMQGFEYRGAPGQIYKSKHPRFQLMWRLACEAQLQLTDTDPEDALNELED